MANSRAVRRIRDNTLPTDINEFLHALQARSKATSAQRIVFGTEVTFRDAKNRKTYYDALERHNTEPDEDPPSFDYNEMGMVTTAATQAREKGILMMVASGPNPCYELTHSHKVWGYNEAERKKHLAGKTDWHTFGVYYKHHTLFIFDPNYEPPSTPATEEASSRKRRITEFKYIYMARDILHELDKQHHRVGKMYMGGGGNTSAGICRTLTAGWLERTVTKWENEEDVDPEEWEEIVR
ncbi:MAG: hypothetical protein M1823_006154 [Watsoniomyces obsoletus]|nr:MAG: hypothetical protein M1823_006154 [Watsoniomyces obsoletus]